MLCGWRKSFPALARSGAINSASRRSFGFHGSRIVYQSPKSAAATKGNDSVEALSLCLTQIEDILKESAAESADPLLIEFRKIHSLGCIVPLPYLFEGVSTLARHRKSLEVERLLLMFQKNVEENSVKSNHSFLTSRSKPPRDPVNKLVSFSVAQLMQSNCMDDALQLWMRMSNSGYITTRLNLEKLLDKVGKFGVSLGFLERMHDVCKQNLWHQSPAHYSRVLKPLRQSIRWAPDSASLHSVLQTLQKWSAESREFCDSADEASTELLGVQATCWAFGLSACKRLGVSAPDHPIHRLCLSEVKSVFGLLLSDSAPRREPLSLKLIDAVQSLSNKVLASENIKRDKSLGTQLHPIHAVRHIDLEKSYVQKRVACSALLKVLAEDGSTKDAIELLDSMINIFKGQVEVNQEKGTLQQLLHRQNCSIHANWSAADQEWLSCLFASLIKVAFSSKRFLPAGELTNEDAVNHTTAMFRRVGDFADQLKKCSSRHGINLSEEFYASWIEALMPTNIQYFSKFSQPSSSLANFFRSDEAWTANQRHALEIVRSLSPEVATSPAVNRAMVTLLCRHERPSAVAMAFEIAKKMSSAKPSSVPVVTWAAILQASTICNSAAVHAKLLEAVVEHVRKHYGPSIGRDPAFLRAKLFANVKLCRGISAVNIIKNLRSCNAVIERQVFHATIRALISSKVHSKQERQYFEDPMEISKWILGEMARDGIPANPSTIILLLRLFLKAVINANTTDKSTVKYVDGAELLLKISASPTFHGHRKVATNANILAEYLRILCASRNEERALECLTSMEATYKVVPSVRCFEAMIGHYAKKGDLAGVEDMLTTLTALNLVPSELIVDLCITAHMKAGVPGDGVDKVQDLFTQFGSRPSCAALLSLIEFSLEKEDVFEARRVVSVIQQLFNEDERARAIRLPVDVLDTSPVDVPHEEVDSSYNSSSDGWSIDILTKSLERLGLDLQAERPSPQEAAEKAETKEEAKVVVGVDLLKGRLRYSTSIAELGGIGSEGITFHALTDESLRNIFKSYGHEL